MMNPALEGLDRAALEGLQLRRLNRLIERLRATNPFYRKAWHGQVPDAPLRSLADVRRFPVLTKEELLADQEAHPPYGRRLGVPVEQVWEITLSSGTSGRTQEVHAHTARDAHLRGLLHGLAFWWAGAGPGDVLAHHVGVSNSASHGSFHRGFRAVGSMPYLVGYTGFAKRLELMESFGLDVMYAMPSALNGLTALCESNGGLPRDRFPALARDRHVRRGVAGRLRRADGGRVGSADLRGLRRESDLRGVHHVELRARRRGRRASGPAPFLRVGRATGGARSRHARAGGARGGGRARGDAPGKGGLAAGALPDARQGRPGAARGLRVRS